MRRAHPAIVLVLLAVATVAVLGVWRQFPALVDADRARVLKLPRSLEDVRGIAAVLTTSYSSHITLVATLFLVVYVSLQCFSIPGSIFLSVLSGTLFGLPLGFALSLTAATLGASCAFGLSYFVTNRFVVAWMPQRLANFRSSFSRHRNHVFWYLIFLRVTPFFPNWFINLCSPIIGVPLKTFVVATTIGIAPATLLCVRAGLTLSQLTRLRDAVSVGDVITMIVFAIIALLPTFSPVQRLLESTFNQVLPAQSPTPASDVLATISNSKHD